jgi:hypothetical protein
MLSNYSSHLTLNTVEFYKPVLYLPNIICLTGFPNGGPEDSFFRVA